ncbi:hypothetical protein QVD17_31491 [Tagetes erecta]|uniref:RRM domain-containing protein n=1 Tax=Tagetes erecta TaxID=13708 RepID=A0AAD8K738_TARER|nr:hypothetical protein QVD17_31491 [Tagetes erecta]
MNNQSLLKPNTLFQIPFIPTSFFLQTNKTHHSLPSIHLPKHKFPSFHLKSPSSSPVFSSKTTTQEQTTTPETESFDLQDEFEDEFDEEFDEEDEDDDIIVPLHNMRQWTRNKPRGFGEGKVYDTKLEDKLLEELEQSRVAQIANINNLKNNPQIGNPNFKKEKISKQKDLEVVPNGIRVRLINLPKKKNIHRDLQAAFKPFTGIINIIPVVSGNEKTREPVCKGFAFVDFKSEKDANRFVDIISTQPITFGKVQKQIRCEITKPSSPKPDSVKPSNRRTESSLPVLNATMAVKSNPVTETQLDLYVEDAALDMLNIGDEGDDGDDDLLLAKGDDNDNNLEKNYNVVHEKLEPEAGSQSLEKQKKVREKGKKKKVEKTTKPNIPGSANRLKMKEKALLSGVFSKYGGKSSD